jgi:GTP cyclohydrolase I
VAVGYLPNQWIIGLSKVPRLINLVAGRPQIQEEFTKHIRDHLAQLVETVDVAVVVRGRHACMEVRGVKSSGEMVTSAMSGAFRDNAQTRAEFMSIIGA